MNDLLPLGLLVLLAMGGKSGSKSTPKHEGKRRGGGRYWAPPRDTPAFEGFDFEGNGLFIDPDCGAVAEGKYFFPFDWADLNLRAEEADTLSATLAIAPDNTALGFVDYLVEQEGLKDPLLVAARMLEELSPQCASVPDTDWGDALTDWYSSLVDRLTAYITQDGIG